MRAGFKGCMKDIIIDRVLLPYSEANQVASNPLFHSIQYDCNEEFYGACSINPCLNNGKCMETGNGVTTCSCEGEVLRL